MNPEEQSDKELYKKYLNGDNKAFEQLIIKYKNQIIFFISRYTKDISIAEDISQDVFVYILLNKKPSWHTLYLYQNLIVLHNIDAAPLR